jgi:HTH-type transcriptional regulator / antitoxin HipB
LLIIDNDSKADVNIYVYLLLWISYFADYNAHCTYQKTGSSIKRTMSDLKKYLSQKLASDSDFKTSYSTGRDGFRIGAMLQATREQAGLTQQEVAQMLNTHKSAISRIEKHGDDVRLSTLIKYAQAFGKVLKIELNDR